MEVKHTKGKAHAGQGYRNGESSISFYHGSIDFQSNEEKEEAETNVRHE